MSTPSVNPIIQCIRGRLAEGLAESRFSIGHLNAEQITELCNKVKDISPTAIVNVYGSVIIVTH